EALDLGIQALAQARDLTLAQPCQPQGLDEIIDLARADAMDVGLLHDRDQRLFGPPAWLQQAGKIAAIAHAWHAERNRAHARVPLPFAVAVALPQPRRRALVPFGAQLLRHLQFHQRLTERLDAVPEEVDLLAQRGLAERLHQCHPQLIGHRVAPSSSRLSNSMRTTRWPSPSTASPIYTLTGTLPRRKQAAISKARHLGRQSQRMASLCQGFLT